MTSEVASILILVTQLERAGAQKVALRQARYFHQRGYQVTLCFFYDKYDLLAEMSRQEPYQVKSLEAKVPGQSRLVNGLRAFRALWRLYRLLRREQIEVVETLTHYSNVLGIMIAWLARVPVRISSQRNTLLGFSSWFLRLDAWLVNSRLVDEMVAVSDETRRFCVDVEGMNPQKVVVIPNGINLEEFDRSQWAVEDLCRLRTSLKILPSARVVLTVARLHPQKGHRYLIQAAPKILATCPNTIFLLVGDGEERTTIEWSIRDASLSEYFRLLGTRRDVPRLLALADLFVLPSIYEGMPNVVLEAMAAKLPVVATDVDGTSEVVADGETGVLVPPANPEALGDAIISLLEKPTYWEKMGQRGYQRVQTQFSEHVMCCRYEKLIQTLLDKKQNSDR